MSASGVSWTRRRWANRFIDTAQSYFNVEREDSAIRKSGVKHENIFSPARFLGNIMDFERF